MDLKQTHLISSKFKTVICLTFYSPIAPAEPDKVQTVQAAAGEVGGEEGAWDGRGGEGESRRPGHWKAMVGTRRAWANAGQNTSG